jgi:hypothetical protein
MLIAMLPLLLQRPALLAVLLKPLLLLLARILKQQLRNNQLQPHAGTAHSAAHTFYAFTTVALLL